MELGLESAGMSLIYAFELYVCMYVCMYIRTLPYSKSGCVWKGAQGGEDVELGLESAGMSLVYAQTADLIRVFWSSWYTYIHTHMLTYIQTYTRR